MMGEVNRSIKDNPALDDVDHALGRPYRPFDSYRNHYATSCADQIAAFRKSAWWEEGGTRGTMTFFYVTDEGRRALEQELKKPAYGRLYRVTSAHHDGERLVWARSRSAARYQAFIDADIGSTFMEFCDGLSVRLASKRLSSANAGGA